MVDRYLRVKRFKPETFWGIKVMHIRDDIKVNFLWSRVHLFDRAAVVMMLERCLKAKQAKVTKVNQKPTSKWRPLPLTTVDLQMMGTRYLRMDSSKVMKVNSLLRKSTMYPAKLLMHLRQQKIYILEVSSVIPVQKLISSIRGST